VLFWLGVERESADELEVKKSTKKARTKGGREELGKMLGIDRNGYFPWGVTWQILRSLYGLPAKRWCFFKTLRQARRAVQEADGEMSFLKQSLPDWPWQFVDATKLSDLSQLFKRS